MPSVELRRVACFRGVLCQVLSKNAAQYSHLGEQQCTTAGSQAPCESTLLRRSPLLHAGISLQGQIQLAAFCGFEFCVGLFWPSMMKMRAQYVPEEMRATIINFFRFPLNLFVCLVLQNVPPF